jgi:hypothetical protein
MADELERLMSQLNPNQTDHLDAGVTPTIGYHDANGWHTNYMDSTGKNHVANENARYFDYIPQFDEKQNIKDKQRKLCLAWDIKRIPWFEVEIPKKSGSPEKKKIVNWELIDRTTMLRMYIYEHFMRRKNEIDEAHKHSRELMNAQRPLWAYILSLEAVLRQNGIDPSKQTTTARPARGNTGGGRGNASGGRGGGNAGRRTHAGGNAGGVQKTKSGTKPAAGAEGGTIVVRTPNPVVEGGT